MNDNWQEAQHADELLRQERLIGALKAAEAAGTPREEVIELASQLGLATVYEKQHTH